MLHYVPHKAAKQRGSIATLISTQLNSSVVFQREYAFFVTIRGTFHCVLYILKAYISPPGAGIGGARGRSKHEC